MQTVSTRTVKRGVESTRIGTRSQVVQGAGFVLVTSARKPVTAADVKPVTLRDVA
jgi:hypothetical protein